MSSKMRARECKRFLALLDGYLDGELAPLDRAVTGAHVEACVMCAQELRHAREARSLLYDLGRIRPSRGFRASLRKRLAAEKNRRDRAEWVLKTLAPAVAPALVLAVFLAFSHRPTVTNLPPMPAAQLATAQAPAPSGAVADGLASTDSSMRATEVVSAAHRTAASLARAAAVSTRRPPWTAGMPARPSLEPAPTHEGAAGRVLDTIVDTHSPQSARQPLMLASNDDRTPSYLTQALVEAAAHSVPKPTLVAAVPEPNAVFVASTETTYAL